MTFTKEWLQQTISGIEAIRDEIPFGLDEDESNTLEALKLALAALTAEPYGYVHKAVYEDGGCCGLSNDHEAHHDSQTHIAVYTAQPAPVLPECYKRLLHHAYGMTMGHDWNKGTMAGHHREKLCQAVEECRAAMLQGAIVVNAPAHYGLRPEQNNRCPAQTPIDHGYRPDCECSGCRGLAAICSGLNGNSPVNTGCWCHACRPVTMNDMRLVVCPECGNKRCPHANDHRHACTGSNEPGQEGSAYPAAPQQK